MTPPDGLEKRAGPARNTRRTARELTLRLLFQRDLEGGSPEDTAVVFEKHFDPGKDDEKGLEVGEADFKRAWPLARELFFGVCRHQAELDSDIEQAADNWRLDRMSPVDRGLIRLAYYEMVHRPDIPGKVSLNEALEIAKHYGDADSRSFINGVLDRLMRRLASRTLLKNGEQ